jgi:hypothetical protein
MSHFKKIVKRIAFSIVSLPLLTIVACTEAISIDPPTQKIVPVVEGTFTNEYKRHEVILRYSSELYSHETKMITGAEVYIIESQSYQDFPGDTIYYLNEDPNNPGHYFTDSIAGTINRWYHLEVNVEENMIYNRPIRMYADSKMPNNVSQIDSLGLLPLLNEQGLPLVDESAAVCICPYFQTLNDENIIYNVELYLNGARFKNRPSKLFELFAMQGYAGYYFNGPEMLQDNIEIPVGIMNKSYLHEGDVVKLKLISLTKDYMYFLINQKLAVGVNPIMGAFPAVLSNLFSNCDAIGWFSTTSSVEVEGIYHEW